MSSKPISLIKIFRDGTGSYIWLSWVSHTYPGKGVTIAINRDITRQKQDNEEQRRTANFLSTLLGAVPTPIFDKDRAGLYQGSRQ